MKSSCRFHATFFLAIAFCLLATAHKAAAGVISFSGDLRIHATDTRCGPGCSLDPLDSDADWAQWAAAIYDFTVTEPSTVQVRTYGFGLGGLEPYLTLFGPAGQFLASSSLGICPAGATPLGGNCFDVELDTSRFLTPGVYLVSLTAWQNMSLAENTGSGNLADGFTGLGGLGWRETLSYGFNVYLTAAGGGPAGIDEEAPLGTVPEPGSAALVAIAAAGILLRLSRRPQSVTNKHLEITYEEPIFSDCRGIGPGRHTR